MAEVKLMEVEYHKSPGVCVGAPFKCAYNWTVSTSLTVFCTVAWNVIGCPRTKGVPFVGSCSITVGAWGGGLAIVKLIEGELPLLVTTFTECVPFPNGGFASWFAFRLNVIVVLLFVMVRPLTG